MRTGQLRGRRARAYWAVLSVLGALVFVISGVAAGLTAYLGAATDISLRSAVSEARDGQTAVQISARGGDDPGAGDAAVGEHLAELLAGVPYQLFRSQSAGPKDLYDGAVDPSIDPPAALTRALFTSYEDLADHAELVAGRWPGQAGISEPMPVAVHAKPAEELGIELDDGLSVVQRQDVTTLQVTGLYQPQDPVSLYWYGSSREIDGSAEGTGLIIAMDEAGLAHIPGVEVTTRWRLAPVVEQLQAADIVTVRAALTRLGGRLQSDARLADAQLAIDDQLGDLIRERGDQLNAARSVVFVPLVLLAMASVIALVLVSHQS